MLVSGVTGWEVSAEVLELLERKEDRDGGVTITEGENSGLLFSLLVDVERDDSRGRRVTEGGAIELELLPAEEGCATELPFRTIGAPL